MDYILQMCSYTIQHQEAHQSQHPMDNREGVPAAQDAEERGQLRMKMYLGKFESIATH